jgi:transposase
MTTEIAITTERIEDFPLLLEIMIRLGLPDILDRHLGRHGLHQGLSWGWIATLWLAHILTQSDHRKRPVQAWLRLLTLIEFVVRRKLKQKQEKLTGLIENIPKKGIDNLTTERLLKEFDEITLTIVYLPGQIIRHVTSLTDLQTRILELLGLSANVYTRLSEN